MRIALLLSTNQSSNRDILRGIKNYSRERRDWNFLIAWPQLTPWPVVKDWKPDGIIAKLYTPEMLAPIRKLGVPLVNTTNISELKVPRVAVDDEQVGALAARHFLERGFRNFAYIGYRQQRSVHERMHTYQDELAARGFTSQCYTDIDLPMIRPGGTWGLTDKTLMRWLKALPKPVGIFLYHDNLAWEILEVCASLHLRVPEEVALLGVDNDRLFCDLARPPLSSVSYPADQIGYRAAQLLDTLMQGKKAPAQAIKVAPVGVVTRESTDSVAMDDPDLAAAVRYIREHAAEPIGVKQILANVPISRRNLELKFRKILGRSPHDAILAARIERARQLLAFTNTAMPEVAVQSGFSNAERLSVIFKKKTGMTPTRYRKAQTQ